MGLKKCLVSVLALGICVGQMNVPLTKAQVLDGKVSSGSLTGVGSVEGVVEQDVMHIILPTTNLNFILDPDGKIKETNASSYGGTNYVQFEEGKDNGYVFFSRTENGKKYYSSSINLEFKNKSPFPVNVSINASFDENESGMTLKSSKEELTGEDAGIYFCISDTDNQSKSVTNSINSGKALLSNGITGVEYQYSYLSGKYKCETVEKDYNNYPGYTVNLYAACNGEASWTNVDASKSKLYVVWNIEKASDNTGYNPPYIKNMGFGIDSKNLSDVKLGVDYNGHGDVSIANVYYSTSTALGARLSSTVYSVDSDKNLIISKAAFNGLKPGMYTYSLEFSDKSVSKVRVEIK